METNMIAILGHSGKTTMENADFAAMKPHYTTDIMNRMVSRASCLVILILTSYAALGGCSSANQMNPSFPLTVGDANEALKEMRDDPKPLERPVLVIGGWMNTGLMTSRLAGVLRGCAADDNKIAHVAMVGYSTFDRCRERVIRAVDEELGTTPESIAANETIEVDVVAFSMGGLVARYAAAERTDGAKRLNIKHLYTIATPHCGANMAPLAGFEPRALEMQHGSALLSLLNNNIPDPGYELTAYVRLGDLTVGQDNCALPGSCAWWVPNRPFEGAHNDAFRDPRILADIARRLRGETPFTRTPAAPLPE